MLKKTLSLIFTAMLSLSTFADWKIIDDFSNPAESQKKWKITQKGSANAEFTTLDGRNALRLSMPAGANKRISVRLLKVPAIPRNGKLIIAFDAKLDWSGTVQGYKNSLWYGTGNEYIIVGQNAICNHGKDKKTFYMNDQTSEFRGNDKWYHYRLTIGQNQQTLEVFPLDAADKPLAVMKTDKHLPTYGNMLCVNMGSMFSPDTFASPRGKMYIADLKYKTEAAKVPLTTINKDDFSLEFNTSNGVMESLKYRNEALTASYDRYELQFRDKTITAMEADNKVEKITRTDDGIEFKLSNPKLPGLKLTQEYKILRDQVSRKITFLPEKTIDGFLTCFAGGELDPQFRQDSVYQTLRGWDVRTIYNAEDITNIIRVGHPQAHWGSKIVTILRADKNLVLAHFGWKRNDQYTWLITQMSKESTRYTPSGWYFPTMIFHPEAGKAESFESIYQVVNGTHLDFYKDYMNRPEVKNITTREYPAWLRDTKLEVVSWYTSIGDYSSYLQKLLDASRYSPEENGIMTIWGWTGWGEFPHKDNDTVYTGKRRKKMPVTAKYFAGQIADAKAENQSVKIGIYQLLWSLPPDALQKHPDWLSFHPDGKPVKMRTEPGWVPVYRRLSNPESRKSIIDGLKSIWQYYPIDYMYIDGGVRGQIYPDWKTMQCDTANKWLNLWKEIFAMAKAKGNDFALHYNNPFPIYSHTGLSENGSFGHWYKTDWRCLADIFTVIKNCQTPGRLLSVLYRSTGHRSNEPQYTNMILASGLTPAGAKDTGTCPNFDNLAAYLPYINAAFELRDTEIKNAVIAPRYFVRGAQVQANVLKLRNSWLISVLRHQGNADKEIKLEIDCSKAGLMPGEQYSLYQIDVTPAEIRSDVKITQKAEAIKLEQIATTRYLGEITIKGKIFSYDLKLPVNRLRFLVLNKSRARIVKVNDRMTQFQLPALLKATVNTKEHGDSMAVRIESPYDSITVKVVLPDALNKSELTLTPAGLKWRRIGNKLEIEIPRKIKEIIIK